MASQAAAALNAKETNQRRMTVAAKETPTQRQTRMYRAIRARISTLRYPPGMMLNETSIAEEFGVSRTPVRRVLQQLSHEGLLEIRNGIGTIVTDIDLKTFKDIYDLRILTTRAMGELSPRPVTDRHRHQMADLIKQAEQMRGAQDVEAYAAFCDELQAMVLDLIGSKPLREITDILYYRVARIWYTFLPSFDWDEVVSGLLEELHGMADAMAKNDVAGVGRVRADYMRWMLQNVSRYMSEDV